MNAEASKGGDWKEPPILPNVVSLADFLAKELPLPEVIVEGMIRKRSVVQIGSGSKSYKSWAALDLGLSVSQGTKWLGKPVVEAKVLFINFELSEAEIQSRLIAVATAKDLDGPIRNFDLWNLRGYARDVSHLMPEIKKHCADRNYSMIIVDPIYPMLGSRNENDAGQIGDFLNHFSQLSEQTHAAVVYTHHYPKGNASKKEAIDRASGSGVFARHADGIITLTKHKTDQAYSVEAELRSFKRMQPFVVKFEYPLMRVAEDLDPADLKARAGAPKKHDVPKLLECLTDGMTSGQWKGAALLQGIKSATFYELRTVAVALDRVMETEDKKWVRKPKVTRIDLMTGEVEVRDAGAKVAA